MINIKIKIYISDPLLIRKANVDLNRGAGYTNQVTFRITHAESQNPRNKSRYHPQ
jgi:hypothetical protein